MRCSSAPVPRLVIRNARLRRIRRLSRNTPRNTGARVSSSNRRLTPTPLMRLKIEFPNFLCAAPEKLSAGCVVTFSRQNHRRTVTDTADVTFEWRHVLWVWLALVTASACSSTPAHSLDTAQSKDHTHRADAGAHDAGAEHEKTADGGAGADAS